MTQRWVLAWVLGWVDSWGCSGPLFPAKLNMSTSSSPPHTHTIPHTQVGRDVFNEKPAADELMAAGQGGGGMAVFERGAVLHTSKGDITLRLFPDECPRTVSGGVAAVSGECSEW